MWVQAIGVVWFKVTAGLRVQVPPGFAVVWGWPSLRKQGSGCFPFQPLAAAKAKYSAGLHGGR
jgi:hypothetical protein